MARAKKSRKVPVLVGLLVFVGLLAWYLMSARHAGEVAGPGAEQKPAAMSASSEPAKPAEPAPAATLPQTAAPAAAPSMTATAAAPAQVQPASPAAAPPIAAAPAATAPAPAPPAAAMPAAAATPAMSSAKPADAAAETKAIASADTATSAGGETSPELAHIQRLLAKLGYEPGAADGRMRAATTRAIRLFQGDVGLKVDGRPTKELLAFMRKLAGKA